MRGTRVLAAFVLLSAPAGAAAQTSAARGSVAEKPGRTWEVNGIRLESSQVDRLAGDIAQQTVRAVARIEGLVLRDAQGPALEEIYRDVALGVYDEAVAVVAEDGIPDAEKEKRIVDLVLAGQERSTKRVAAVLDAGQYARYRAWEERQVQAFRERGLWSAGSRRRSRR
jgi:hypothetical protein